MSEHNTNESNPENQGDSDPSAGSENSADPGAENGTVTPEGQEIPAGADAGDSMDVMTAGDSWNFLDTLFEFFQTGGAFMYPILIVFSLGLAISIERYIKLSYERGVNRKMWKKLQPILADADFSAAREMVEVDDKSTISKLMAMGLERQGAVRRRDDIEIAMEECMMEIIPQLEKRTPFIALFSNICTLLGLLGTIMGLIQAFTAVANANPADKADLLSASISVAMNTTAFGLMAGIPLLILHAFLTSRTGEIVDGLEMASVKTLNVISSASKRQRDAKQGPSEITMTSPPAEQSAESDSAEPAAGTAEDSEAASDAPVSDDSTSDDEVSGSEDSEDGDDSGDGDDSENRDDSKKFD